MGTCKLCGSEAKLVDSHIVPRAFYPKGQPLEVRNTYDNKVRRSPVGVYDQIICDPCERITAVFDTYAAKVLKPRPRREDYLCDEYGFKVKGSTSKYAGYWIDVDKPHLLRGFAYSLLFRAAVTKRPEMKLDVDEPCLEKCRQSITKDHVPWWGDVLIQRFCEPISAGFVSRPVVQKHPPGGWEFNMGGVLVSVFRGHVSVQDDIKAIKVGAEERLLIPLTTFAGSNHELSIREIALRDMAGG